MGFQEAKNAVLDIARKNGSCIPGFKDAMNVDNFNQMVAVFKKYIAELLGRGMHSGDVFPFLEAHYEANAEEFQKHGLYYNCNADHGIVFIHNPKEMVYVGGTSESYVYGKSVVHASGQAKVFAKEDSVIHLYDYSSGIFDDDATGYLHDRSEGNARDNNILHTYDSSVLVAGGTSTVNAHGWQSITAIGDAEVFAFSPRKIYMNGNKKLHIKPIDE